MEEKKSFREKLHGWIDKLGTIALMNAMFLLASIPVVTIGPAWSGLVTAIRYYVRGDKWFHGFKFGYKTRFWRSLLSFDIMVLPIFYFITEINHHWQHEQLLPLIFSALIFVLLTMLCTALQILNVYIPTPVGRWIRNAGDMIKTAHLKLAVVAVLFWLPLLLFLMAFDIFYFVIIIFIAAYFALTGFATTLLLKANLIEFLIDARADGVLLAEEGRVNDETDEEEE